jgi:hypothetical protein
MVLLPAPRLILQPLDPQYVDGIHSHIRRQVCGLTSIEIIAATAFSHPISKFFTFAETKSGHITFWMTLKHVLVPNILDNTQVVEPETLTCTRGISKDKSFQ